MIFVDLVESGNIEIRTHAAYNPGAIEAESQ